MITITDKETIYAALSSRLEFGKAYSPAIVGRVLSTMGLGCSRFGYKRLLDLLKDMPELIRIDTYERDGKTLYHVYLNEWDGKSEEVEAASAKEPVPSSAEAKPGRTKAAKVLPFTDSVKKEINALLREEYPAGQSLAMGAFNQTLMENGYEPKRYGFSSTKEMLSQMPEYLQITENEVGGIVNDKVTLRRHVLDQAPTDSAVSSGQEAEEAPKVPPVRRIRRDRLNERRQEEIRASSGGVRFSSTASSAETFRREEKLEPKEEKTQQEQSKFIRSVYISPKLQSYLLNKGMADPQAVLENSYQQAIENKTYEQRNNTISFPVNWGDEKGMVAVLKKNERPVGKRWYLGYVSYPEKELEEAEEEEKEDEEHPIKPGQSLEHFADLGVLQDFLSELARMAVPEEWSFNNRRLGKYYILKKYIQYTFYRLMQEDKICISKDKQFAAFNTGLVNNRYDDIFACFIPNPKHAEDEEAPEWKFETFALAGIRGKDGYGKMLTSYFNPLPQVPHYFESKDDLIYDVERELVTDYEHIIVDNMGRLPLGYLRECCYGDDEAQRMINAIEGAQSNEKRRQAVSYLSRYVDENDRIYRRLRSRMEDAIDMALKRVRWNYRAAVPCYFPKGNCMSMMLPLCLEDDTVTDAALVVLKNPSGSYQGQTVLQLDKAYLDARLVCRPDLDWLKLTPEADSRQSTVAAQWRRG